MCTNMNNVPLALFNTPHFLMITFHKVYLHCGFGLRKLVLPVAEYCSWSIRHWIQQLYFVLESTGGGRIATPGYSIATPSRRVSSSLLVELLKAPWRDEKED